MRAPGVYRVLLWCYPAEFRHEYGGQMAGAFAEQLRDAGARDGRLAQAGVWARALIELPSTALQEHWHVIRQDLRHAVRLLATSPGFTAVAVLSLALGIGANTAIFSLLNSVLLNTLPVKNPHELVMLTDPGARGVFRGSQQGERALATYQEFRQLQRNDAFARLMASSSSLQRIDARVDGAEPEPIAVRLVSAAYFSTLGVPAVVGRTFDGDQEPAARTAPFAVVSHEYWQRRFAGRSDVVGRRIAFRDGIVTIVGVTPESFFGETVGERSDVWVPLAMQPAVLPGRDWLNDQPGSVEKLMWLHVFGRVAPGVTPERAEASANLTFRQGLAAYYGSIGDAALRTRYNNQRLKLQDASTGASGVRGAFSEPLWVLLGAAGLVLLIACANLGNLLLARTTARAHEMSVRLALGAGRTRLMRQLLTESACLALAGGLASLFLARLFRDGLLGLVADPTMTLASGFHLRTLAFVFALTLVVAVVLGLLPALRITGTRPAIGLREGRGVAGSAAWLGVGKLVVVGQLALSLPLLVGAALLVRTLMNLEGVDLGYSTRDLLSVRVDAEAAGYETVRQMAAFEAIAARLRAVPGVRSLTYSYNGLFGGTDNGDRITVDGYTPVDPMTTQSRYDAVAPGFFSTLGIPVLAGREITDQDQSSRRMVCVINESFARKFFNGRNPIGLRVTQHDAEVRRSYEVVGVVRDSRQASLRDEVETRFYTPLSRAAVRDDGRVTGVTFIIKPRGGASVLTDVRQAIQRTEPNMPIGRALALSDLLGRRMVQDRMLAQLSIAFGIVAVALAALGLYGVLSYGIARRTGEIAIRKALGAQPVTLIAMIARETGWLVVAGLVVGGALSVAAVRLISSRLYGLSPTDPATFASAVAAMALVAVIATWLPARRTTRVDAIGALRFD
jgi:predicted permease